MAARFCCLIGQFSPMNGPSLVSRWRAAAVAILLISVAAPFAEAQQTTGVLRGQILDPGNAVVPKVAVTLTGPDATTRSAQADEAGTFVFLGQPEGAYSVRVLAPGFAAFEQQLALAGGRITTM